jgi:(1->4)-alpha-D-glucan 1-alpha-D-glucosylmutase
MEQLGGDPIPTAPTDILAEYLSVITAFKNIPDRNEPCPERIQERNREKEIAKKRLSELASHSGAVREFVESRVRIFNGVKGESQSMDSLDRFLDLQVYRMAFWRTASEEINYRRFFDINELAAIRIEDERVFEYYHRLTFDWLAEGKIHGLRIDHPDGLYDPPVYFRRLQKKYLKQLAETEWQKTAPASPSQTDREMTQAASRKIDEILEDEAFASAKPLYVVAEKILDRKEDLPDNWCIHGTVGYDFLNVLNGIFIAQNAEKDFSKLYEEFIGHTIDFDQLLYDKKKLFALVHMSSEINTLGHRLNLISEKDRHYRDFTRNNLTLAIREVIACFPVYRTYLSPEDDTVSERDETYIKIAVEKAKAKTPALNPAVYDFLKEVLLLRFGAAVTAEAKKLYREFVLRFQQITGPIMAKGLEDTSFYIYNRFLSLNEVGGDPFHFGHSRDEFHRFNQLKAERWPHGMLCTSTHDTKRSEDARMRINVLSELLPEWESALTRWTRMNNKHRVDIKGTLEPRRNTEYFIYQSLLAVWPDGGGTEKDFPSFPDRVWEYMLKSVREAKTFTNWINPNPEYENAIRKFIDAILDPDPANLFPSDLLPLQQKLSFFGKLNSLSALTLKLGAPGVVDTYQGAECWNLCLVDPDNRRPVDFEMRKNALKSLRKGPRMLEFADDFFKRLRAGKSDAVKMQVMARGLHLRRSAPGLFLEGDYLPLKAEGSRSRNIVAFMRKKGDRFAIFTACRFFTELTDPSADGMPGPEIWGDTKILLPKGTLPVRIQNDMTGEAVIAEPEENGFSLRASALFDPLSFAILTNWHPEEAAFI